MKVLAICGGLRDDSNTNKLVRKITQSCGHEYEIVELSNTEIKPCTGCSSCMMNEGKCAIDDDMQELYEKMMSADAIIIGSPTYYVGIAGAVKCLIDRTIALFYRGIGPMYDPDMPFMGQRPLAGKLGIIVTTVAGAGHEKALEALSFCMGEAHRLNLIAKIGEVIEMNDVDDLPEVMKRSEDAGKRLGEALNQIH